MTTFLKSNFGTYAHCRLDIDGFAWFVNRAIFIRNQPNADFFSGMSVCKTFCFCLFSIDALRYVSMEILYSPNPHICPQVLEQMVLKEAVWVSTLLGKNQAYLWLS